MIGSSPLATALPHDLTHTAHANTGPAVSSGAGSTTFSDATPLDLTKEKHNLACRNAHKGCRSQMPLEGLAPHQSLRGCP